MMELPYILSSIAESVPDAGMLALIGTVLATSLLGSMHCAGMCGPFVLLLIGSNPNRGAQPMVHLMYHAGRGISYTLLGGLAGSLGSVLNLGGEVFGFQRIAMIVAGAAMALFGLLALFRMGGARIPKVKPPVWLARVFHWGQRYAQGRHPVVRATMIGLLSILLPCGWLYLYVVVAAGTGQALWGALTMFVFWLGTVPILVAFGVGVQTFLRPFRRHLPWAMAMLMILAGGTIFFRGMDMDPGQSLVNIEQVNQESSIDELREAVLEVDQEELPCCKARREAAEAAANVEISHPEVSGHVAAEPPSDASAEVKRDTGADLSP